MISLGFNEKVLLLNNKKKRKVLYSAFILTLSIVVIIAITLSLVRPAMSATEIADNSNTIDDVQMLIGSGNDDIRGNNVSETISKANEKYALGIASQFSVFLLDNFKSTVADTEGRTAVGGNFDVSGYRYGTGTDNKDGYRVGLGHYVGSEDQPVGFDDLTSYKGSYAHGIIGGYVYPKLAVEPDISQTPYYRRFVVNSEDKLDGYYSYNKWAFYTKTSDILDFSSAFAVLNKRSKLISANAKKTSEQTSVSISGNTVIFKGTGTDKTENSIMFNVTAEQWQQISQMSNPIFDFVDIPKSSVSISGKEVRGNEQNGKTTDYSTVDVNWENTYIMINVEGSGAMQMPQTSVTTNINGYCISKGGKNSNETYPNLNNKFGCSTLLYNFSNASSLKLGGDFQGTIFAPNTDVTDSTTNVQNADCPGHLSGALIAKSFDGNTEFGYRPYEGPIEILGTSSDYQISVDKLDSETSEFLPGAKLGLYENGNDSSPIYTWISGTSTEYVNVSAGKKYYVKEIAPPDDYQLTDTVYYFEVTEDAKETENLSFDETVYERNVYTNLSDEEISSGNYEPVEEREKFGLYKLSWSMTLDSLREYFPITLTLTDSNNKTYSYTLTENNISFSNENWQEIQLDDACNNKTFYSVNIKSNKSSSLRYGLYFSSANDWKYYDTDNAELSYSTAVPTEYYKKSSSDLSGTGYETTAKTVAHTLSVSYVPKVTIKMYSDDSFSTVEKTLDYSTTDLNNTYYDINDDDNFVLGSDLKNGENGVTVVTTSSNKSFIVVDNAVLSPTIRLNKFVFENQQIPKGASITLEKVNSSTGEMIYGKGSKSAKMDLYDSADNLIGSYTLGQSDITNGLNENYIVDYNNIKMIKPGEYYLVESSVPSGYKIDNNNNRMEFTVNLDGTVTAKHDLLEYDSASKILKIKNEPISLGKIKITKKWLDYNGNEISNPPVQSITVNIYRSADQSVASYDKAVLYQTVTLNANNNWTVTLNKGAYITDQYGKDYRYFVKEEPELSGYEVSYNYNFYGHSHIILSSDKENAIEITNNEIQKLEMPSTGGTGNYLYYAVGGSIFAFASISLIIKRRKITRHK